MSDALGLYNYWIVVFLMMAGFYNVIARGNLIKKLVGLSIFQTSVFMLYISLGKIEGGTAPILAPGFEVYSNPLPHVLILTAIVGCPQPVVSTQLRRPELWCCISNRQSPPSKYQVSCFSGQAAPQGPSSCHSWSSTCFENQAQTSFSARILKFTL